MRIVAIVAASLALAFGLSAPARPVPDVQAASPPPAKDGRRVVGYGQIRFNGAGPERWALRWRREHRTSTSLRRHLSSELDRLVWMVRAFECIYRHERGAGGWATNTGNGYYGGLQMDLSFQRAYGAELLRTKGTADRWTPADQIAVAIRAWATRGFYPWPNTARACGLL